jgi:hypothetical protein
MNTLSLNHAATSGGIYKDYSAFYSIYNSILWNNDSLQIFWTSGDSSSIAYCDIQNSLWPGLGNISQNPDFVDPEEHEYRLMWNSPCIDAGNPDSLDPDGTRSDMGAFYYDQRYPVHVLLTPHEIPYLIPAEGGTMLYTLRVSNHDPSPYTAFLWCDVTLPEGSSYGPVLGPLSVTIPATTMLARVRSQEVPAVAPMGVYHYNAYAVVASDTSKDSFMFGKLGSVGRWPLVAGGWSNSGEDFVVEFTTAREIQPSAFNLHPCSPNPFNPTTDIRYQMPEARQVSLRVYDMSGRLVTTLVDGWRQGGEHEVTFDGSNLASGLYFVRLQAGEFTAVQKLLLLK